MNLLIVEDDQALCESLSDFLSRESYSVTSVFSVDQACKANLKDFKLVILDWNLPDGQGLDLLKLWRKSSPQIPIIFLTAKADLTDKILGLELGASDFITKPFEPRELLARIRVQLRSKSVGPETIAIGSVEIDLDRRRVTYKNREVLMSKTEFELFRFLALSPEKVFSRDELLREVWGFDRSPTTRTVDTHVLQLRQKLSPEHIETVHGIGYRLRSIK